MTSLSSKEQLSVLADVNMLRYAPSVDGSVANSRCQKRYNFTPLNYNSAQSAQIQVNSGSDYISGPTSYIVAKVNFIADGTPVQWNTATGGPGSAFNLFKEFQIAHISGDVIDRTDRLNVLVSTLVAYMSNEYRLKMASLFDYGSAVTHANGTNRTYVFPLFLCSGLFAQKALIPAQLMAGAKIKVQLEGKATALVGNAQSDYSISDMSLVLDSVDLFDAMKKVLMQQAANVRTQGLQYPYHSYFHLQKNESTSQLNFDINVSVAKTINLLVKERHTDEIADVTVDSMASAQYDYLKWRMRIGSHTMPDYEVDSDRESYAIALNSFGTAENDDLLSRHYNHTGVSYSEYITEHGIVCQSLEKQPILALSGEPTNAARLLNFSATMAASSDRVFDAYIKHLRVANVMQNNIVIDR